MIARTSNQCQTENHIISAVPTCTAGLGLPAGDCPANRRHSSWQQELADARISVEDLLKVLGIPLQDYQAHLLQPSQTANFPLRVTASFIRRMQSGNINDPLLLQVLPVQDELLDHPLYSADPLDENSFNPAPGIIRKYSSRALLIVTQACAIHCRYCFRKQFPYSENRPGLAGWQQSLDHLRSDVSINEVIYSGGDPLAAADEFLSQLTASIANIPHIKRLRLHSRLPVVLPARVDDRLLEWLGEWPGQAVMVIHCNHPNELDEEVRAALARLASAGVTLLNQAVLLKGVNDEVNIQIALSEKLFACGVMPYYLHMLDKVSGTRHFAVPRAVATQLAEDMRHALPGYLVPKLVEELPGEAAKSPVFKKTL